MAVQLRITFPGGTKTTAMRFNLRMSVSEVLHDILEVTGEGGPDHGLLRPADSTVGRVTKWLEPERTLEFYDIGTGEELILKKKHRLMKVEMLDGVVRTMIMDDSLPVQTLAEEVGKKMFLRNPEEFSLQWRREESPKTKKVNRLKKMDQLEGGVWLNPALALGEQGVPDDAVLLLEKKFWVDDKNVDTNDPTQLHYVYVQCLRDVLSGKHRMTKDEAIKFASLQCQILWGNYQESKHNKTFFKDKDRLAQILPYAFRKKNMIDEILKEWHRLFNFSSLTAKLKFFTLCRSLKTYGVTYFDAEWKLPGKMRLYPVRLGITREGLIFENPGTGKIVEDRPFFQLYRWAVSKESITLDFGDYRDVRLALKTKQGEAISMQLNGYIDIFLHTRGVKGTIVSEYEGEIAEEAFIAPAIQYSTTSITSTTFGGSMPEGSTSSVLDGGAQVPGLSATQQGVLSQVSSLEECSNAVLSLLDELYAPAPLGSHGALTPEALRQAISTSNKSLLSAAGQLINEAREENASTEALNKHSKALSLNLAHIIGAAKIAAANMGGDVSLLDGSKSVAGALRNLLGAVGSLAENPNSLENKTILLDATIAFRDASAAFKATAVARLDDNIPSNQLLEAAKSVAAATRELLNTTMLCEGVSARRVDDVIQEASGGSNQQPAGLVDAARVLGEACNKLVAVTVQYQTERVVADPSVRKENVYCDDPTWSNGLISAAQAVGVAIQDLVKSAIGFVKKEEGADEDMLLASAKQVAAATARLRAASNAKSDPSSPSHKSLIEASNKISAATNSLLEAARSLNPLTETPPHEAEWRYVGDEKTVKARRELLYAQAEVLRLERELEEARNRVAALYRAQYDVNCVH